MVLIDERTGHERKTHPVIVMATDSFMSGWGEAEGGMSYAGWACTYENQYIVERWVRNRSDMKRVRIVGNDYKPRAQCKHCHIYIVKNGHPALS